MSRKCKCTKIYKNIPKVLNVRSLSEHENGNSKSTNKFIIHYFIRVINVVLTLWTYFGFLYSTILVTVSFINHIFYLKNIRIK